MFPVGIDFQGPYRVRSFEVQQGVELLGDARVEDAYRKVVAACRKHNIHPGMGGVYEPKLLEKYNVGASSYVE